MFTPFALTASSSTWSEIRDELAPLGQMICEAADAYLAEYPHKHRRPDCLSLHFWPDRGTVYAVLVGPKKFRGNIGTVMIPRLEREYYDLPPADGSADNAFDAAHDALMERVREAIHRVLALPSSADCLSRLRSTLGMRIVTVEYDDIETERRAPFA